MLLSNHSVQSSEVMCSPSVSGAEVEEPESREEQVPEEMYQGSHTLTPGQAC